MDEKVENASDMFVPSPTWLILGSPWAASSLQFIIRDVLL